MKIRLNAAEEWQEVGGVAKVASFDERKGGGAILITEAGVEVFMSKQDLEAFEDRLPRGAG